MIQNFYNNLFLNFQGQVRIGPQNPSPGVRRGVRRQVHKEAAARRGHDARDTARGGRAGAVRWLHQGREPAWGQCELDW